MYSKPTKLVLTAGHCWIAWLLEMLALQTYGLKFRLVAENQAVLVEFLIL